MDMGERRSSPLFPTPPLSCPGCGAARSDALLSRGLFPLVEFASFLGPGSAERHFAPHRVRDKRAALRYALQERLFRGVHGVGRADMHPDAVEAEAE
jgi:hypothetical protein